MWLSHEERLPSISLAGKQIAFQLVSGANPEESLWQTPNAFGAPGAFFMKNAG
jgi:hypothetical protein